jgi:uncharacterized protein
MEDKMKIDIYSHILPEKYIKAYRQKNPKAVGHGEGLEGSLTDLNIRFRILDRFPDVLQVLTISRPPLDKYLKPKDAVELAKIANDELAEIVNKYPNRFYTAAACLPMNDLDAALVEADRAINQLGFHGVQISTINNGETLDNPQFRPLYKKMAGYNLPIWIHPETRIDEDLGFNNPFNWPYETSLAMLRLVISGVFDDFPNIKFITHHCGAMVPFFEKRIKVTLGHDPYGRIKPIPDAQEIFRRFYTDTAVYGSTGALMCGYSFFGADHLLFGTDMPLGPKFGCTGETIDSIERMNISIEDKEKVFFRNAVKLLGVAY